MEPLYRARDFQGEDAAGTDEEGEGMEEEAVPLGEDLAVPEGDGWEDGDPYGTVELEGLGL